MGDGNTTFVALADAYKLVAAEVARRDPTIDPEPAVFGVPLPGLSRRGSAFAPVPYPLMREQVGYT